MRKLLLYPPRLCRECLRRSLHQLSTAGDASAASKPVPLRIFATEADSDGENRSFIRTAEFGLSPNSPDRQDQAWPNKFSAQAPPAERLSNDLKNRAGRPRPRSAFELTKSPTSPKAPIRMSSRMPVKSNPISFNAASPTDLLQPPEGLEKETILAAIDACLSAAMDRLDLSTADTNPQPSSPGKRSVPHDQYMWICNILQFQFSKNQLTEYAQTNGVAKVRLTRECTATVIRIILNDIWNLEKEPEPPPDEALITKNIPITPRERFFMIGEDGGGTLWRWVYHCQARIVADLNKPVLKVTATPGNLKKLEWVIRQMFKDSENDKVDLTALRPLGRFDASYFLPVIARLSSTYIDVNREGKDELGLVALGISALGKKRHRVEIARQLVVGSLNGNFEKNKDIFYPVDDTAGNALLRVLDSSLPWWTERDTWGRWTKTRAAENGLQMTTNSRFRGESLKLQLASSNRHSQYENAVSTITFSQVIQQLLDGVQDGAPKTQFRMTATPGHILHNTLSLDLKNSEVNPSELIKVAAQSAGDISPPQIFSPHNVNFRAIIQAGHLRSNTISDMSCVYNMSFIASPWDFPEGFGRIPELKLRAIMEPGSWEVRELQARLSFGRKFMDIMLPSLGCDLRLCREEYLPIPSAESMEAFVNYLHQTGLDPARNRRLTAPPFLHLDLSSGDGSIKYFLTKMDFRKELIRDFSGHEMVYTSVDGGEAWGRRKQITMTIAENEHPTSLDTSIGAIEEMISEAGY